MFCTMKSVTNFLEVKLLYTEFTLPSVDRGKLTLNFLFNYTFKYSLEMRNVKLNIGTAALNWVMQTQSLSNHIFT